MPIIADKPGKGNPSDIPAPREGFLARIPDGALTCGVVIVASVTSFGLGILYEREAAPKERIEFGTFEESSFAPAPSVLGASAASSGAVPRIADTGAASGSYVASKNGEKYYLPSCSGAKRIKEENKVWFPTKEAAEAAGYEPAVNCKGL